MAWAIFTDRFVYDRGIRAKIAFDIQPCDEPKNFPSDVVAAAIAAGKAMRVLPQKRQAKQIVTAA